MKKRILLFMFIFLSLMVAKKNVLAAEYYVSPNGTEVWPNCTSQSNPCRASNTVKDFLGAVAGDTVYFLDGVYSGLTAPDSTYERTPSWFPTNSGIAENPIVFKALNRRQAILEGLDTGGEGDLTDYIVPIIGCEYNTGKSYATWDGFVLRAVASDGTTPIMARASMYSCDNYTINDCEIIGTTHSLGGAVNWDGVRFEGSDYITITNNYIHGWKETTHNWNTSGLKCYDSYYATISNNNFEDNYNHLYIKGYGNGNFQVYNNYFKDGDYGIHNSMNLVYTENDHEYYNNLFNGVHSAFGDGGVGEATAANPDFHNNTVYAPNSTAESALITFPTSPDGSNAIFYNNIIVNGTKRAFDTRSTGDKFQQADHNLIYPDFSTLIGIWDGYRTYSTLAAWQASTELYEAFDAGCGSNQNPGCGSLVADPLFINTSGTYSEINDFALQPESPAKGSGRGGVDMGANISLVGIQGALATSPTCTDNIQNQDETSIDCGGVCEACTVPTTYGLSNFISAITNWLGIGNTDSDANNDGVVNTRDLGVMMSSWGN